ncbi:MAG: hypothetical protein GEV11_16710 [Streptosporangiales bacterium]|nr:hypothetical protein [Streptosporangiales bacterium]
MPTGTGDGHLAWVRTDEHQRNAAELDADATTQEVIAGWRATARIKADPADHRAAMTPTTGDFGSVDTNP